MRKMIVGWLAVLWLAACASGTPASLTGQWKLVAYGTPDKQASAVADVETSIEFKSDGTLSGNVGCNGFGGDYQVQDSAITLGPVMSTMMFCEGPVGDQEMSTLAVLKDSARFVLDGDNLTITSADGSAVIILARK